MGWVSGIKLAYRVSLKGLYGRVNLQGLSWGDQMRHSGQSGGLQFARGGGGTIDGVIGPACRMIAKANFRSLHFVILNNMEIPADQY